jgi:YjbE family integral membrane protein
MPVVKRGLRVMTEYAFPLCFCLFGKAFFPMEVPLDLGAFGTITFNLKFLSDLVSIIIINLILAGDNAVVIAIAIRSLPHEQRIRGIIFGSGAAVVLRIILTFFVAQLLEINYLKIFGGALILWIAVKLFVESMPEENSEHETTTIGQAIKLILIADISMSLDNMLAVAGVSNGNFFLLLFGLGLSIPFVVFASNLLSTLMDKYPVIISLGAAILGKVGGEMLITDPFTVGLLHPSRATQYIVEALFAAGVIVAGKIFMNWRSSRREHAHERISE